MIPSILLAALQMDFQQISKAVLIEGPLHPDVVVTPPSFPPHLGGRDDGAKKLLPKGYRHHLFWSREKMTAVRKIIEGVCGSPS